MQESYPEYAADVLDESNRPLQYEIGADEATTPWDAFASEPVRVGNVEIGEIEIGNTEIGNVEIGNTEIGAALALRKVVEKARDNRTPAPPMKTVALDAPEPDNVESWALTDTCLGAAEVTPDPFPLLAKLLQKAGAGVGPRIVRIDTEESFRDFRAKGSPEYAEFRERMDDFEHRLHAHASDPHAHDQLADEAQDLAVLGAVADKSLAARRIEFKLDPSFDGKHEEWVDDEDDTIYASLKLSHPDGSVRWVTSTEPRSKSIAEMSRHAGEANVPVSAIVGMLPAAGEVLGAGTAIKEMVAAVPALMNHPEMRSPFPFIARIEPRANPGLFALAALALECTRGNAQACDEWKRLCGTGHGVVRQAMAEALALVQKAAS